MAAAGADLVSLLPASNVVGTLRARHPTIYIFTGGNEDAAFLSIYGFNFLLDGGDQEEVSYWNFIKNYDKINVVLSTRPSPECLRGISTILARKAIEQCHPKIGAFIGNLPPRVNCSTDNDAAKAILSVYEGLQAEGIKPYDVYAHPKMEPLTLYEVLGEGSLKMIVLNPDRNSKDLFSLANAVKTGEGVERLSVITSIAVVLIWQPFDHSKPTIRILYPGACPLEKLYASLEKLKGEECLRHVEFVSADREKYSSNVSLNMRTPLRRTGLPLTKPSPTLRIGTKTATVAPPRSLPSKTSSPSAKPVAKPAHTEVKSRVSDQHTSQARSGGTVKKPAHSPASSASHLRTAGSSRLHTKTNTAAVKSPANVKKEHTTSKVSNAKPPAVPRKSFVLPHIDEKKKVQAGEDYTTIEKPVSVTTNTETTVPVFAPDSTVLPAAAGAEKEKGASLPNPVDFTAEPQNPDAEGLLDGIEEPAKLHLIGMDVDGENLPLKAETAIRSKNRVTTPDGFKEVAESIGVFSGDQLPASVGLSNLIIAENPAEPNKPLIDTPAPQAPIPAEARPAGDSMPDYVSAKLEKALKESETEVAAHRDQLNLAPDAALVQPHSPQIKPDLDSVIQSLTEDSKKYDLTQDVDAPALVLPQKEALVRQNGNASEALQVQNAFEDAHAREEYLPCTPPSNKPQTKRVAGLVTKPKLSQPLYFDVVFVPHHGARPALLDEVAAKAFAISVRSKRYVLSGRDAGKPYILDGFISAKNVWNKPELEIDVLPTHSTEGLFNFNASKQAEMIEAGMNLRCAADRCQVRLTSGSDANDYCAAFKFEL